MITYLLLGFIVQMTFVVMRLLAGVYDLEACECLASYGQWLFAFAFGVLVWPFTVVCEILYATKLVKRPIFEVEMEIEEEEEF